MLAMSFRSEEVCRRIVRTKLHCDIFGYLDWDKFPAKILDDAESRDYREFVEKLLDILHKVVKKTERASVLCGQPNAVEILQKFRSVTKFPVS